MKEQEAKNFINLWKEGILMKEQSHMLFIIIIFPTNNWTTYWNKKWFLNILYLWSMEMWWIQASQYYSKHIKDLMHKQSQKWLLVEHLKIVL